MKYLDMLPYNIIRYPEVCVIEVVPLYKKFTVRITDGFGKEWYIQTVGRTSTEDSAYPSRYDWTRSRLSAKLWTYKTAQKHMCIIGQISNKLCEET